METFMTSSQQVAKVMEERNNNRLRKLAEALNRYGRHEKGCGMLRTPSRMAECSCGLHAAIRAGGVKP